MKVGVDGGDARVECSLEAGRVVRLVQNVANCCNDITGAVLVLSVIRMLPKSSE